MSLLTNHILFLAIAIICYGCKPPVKESDPLPALLDQGLYIVNEGNFMSGNGSVSFYDSATNHTTQDLFFLKNNKPAGDVCQSLAFYKNQFYLVVNNSSKIELLNEDFVNTKTISGLTSPRYIAFASNEKGYITDLYANGVSVLNTKTSTIEKKITINYRTEEILEYSDTLYVTSPASKYLYLIDSKTDLLKDSIDIGYGSSSITQDQNKMLWILCDGSQSNAILPSLVCINPSTRQIVRSIQAADYTSFASKINYNPIDKHIYWIDSGIYKLNTTQANASKVLAIDSKGRNFYALGINQKTGDIIVSDAGDFSQRSTIYIYSKTYIEKKTFQAGLISGYILVK